MPASLDYVKFKEGSCFDLYDILGSHTGVHEGVQGAFFTVWAPHARKVSVIGDFNDWDVRSDILSRSITHPGFWRGFVPRADAKDLYKYHITSENGKSFDKSDPYARYFEVPAKTASVIWEFNYGWHDQKWMKRRVKEDVRRKPMSVYEVHLGSWRRGEGGRFLTYRELADRLIPYVKEIGFTHIEIMPVMEHPFYGSWGYQTLGYFAPTARYGEPEDFMHFVDQCHRHGIGVILDWVPSHFPNDPHGLAEFDGTKLYEDEEYHPDWNSCVFSLERSAVRQFLISNALFWLDRYHVDGLRVDAVASMLYLDYSRQEGQWKPNIFGGRENLEAVAFIRQLNDVVHERFPGVQVIAEESTAWPKVSRPVSQGGLGFDMKWNMGWMHDTLRYLGREPAQRGKHHGELSFCLYYAFHENFILSLSHDEVVHEKNSLLGKMPGNDLQRFANLRCLYGYMYGHPGKKLLFMGSEIAPESEWDHEGSLDWSLLKNDRHLGVQKWVRDLNVLYQREPALHDLDFSSDGFDWMDIGFKENGVAAFVRKDASGKDLILVVCHFKNRGKRAYRIGVPKRGVWVEVLNSNDKKYGGTGSGVLQNETAEAVPCHGGEYAPGTLKDSFQRDHSITLDLPPLSVMFLKRQAA